jgi:hypothetical protein
VGITLDLITQEPIFKPGHAPLQLPHDLLKLLLRTVVHLEDRDTVQAVRCAHRISHKDMGILGAIFPYSSCHYASALTKCAFGDRGIFLQVM